MAADSTTLSKGFGAAALLVGVAVAGAATTGTLATVGPYLLGVSVLIGSLFALDRWLG
ncbi:hypothetical protein [Halorussus marinus]|uniref:hypothetical protein n=1 Tax=Halorussus marinus TaxID=2505976 RepID=UPI001431D709|nr:hypothetical protein [Halorussus marinus]